MDKNTWVDRRRSVRRPATGLVNLTIMTGEKRKATLAGVLMDVSDNGVCVLLDGGAFDRGMVVTLELSGELPLPAWVCHSTSDSGYCRVGLSFEPIDVHLLDTCWEPALCQVRTDYSEGAAPGSS